MKKDKKWLESVIIKELMTNSGNPDMTTHEQGRVSALKYYLKLINQLDEPDSTDEYRKGYEQGVLNAIQTANGSKLVEIPQFVADWIEKAKGRHHSLYQAMNEYCTAEMNQWIKGFFHSDTFAKAWLDGYTIEKEPQYCIRLGNLYFKDEDEGIIICTQLKEYAFAGEGKDGAQETANKYGGIVEEWDE